MKKIYLLPFLLITVISYSQANKSDAVNDYLIEYLKKQEIESGPERSIYREKAQEIINKTTDTVVKNKAIKYLLYLDSKVFDNSKTVNFESFKNEKLKKFKVKTDKFTGTTFITHKDFSTLAPLQTYIVIKNNEAFLRVTTNYNGSGWIFMNRLSLLLKGSKYSYDIKKPEREVTSGSYVRENADQIADKNLLEILKSFNGVDSDVEIRLEGDSKYYDTRIKARQIPAINETIEIYDAL